MPSMITARLRFEAGWGADRVFGSGTEGVEGE